MVDFFNLKKQRDETFAKLNSKLNSIVNPVDKDDRFWSPTVDKEGNGYAVIRFLPTAQFDLKKDNEALPFIRFWDHGFKGPGGWYIKKSLTSLNQNDPCSEMNTRLWNTGTKQNKDFVSGTPDTPGSKRRLHFVSNIFVIEDRDNPMAVGKVWLFKYGKKIFDKLHEASNPKFPDKEAINPFDFWTGANFKLKIRKEDGYRNYNSSDFTDSRPLFDDDKKLNEIWDNEYPLLPFLNPSEFESYDELKRKLDYVMGTVKEDIPRTVEQAMERKVTKEPGTVVPWEEPDTTTGEEDPQLDYFKNLVSK